MMLEQVLLCATYFSKAIAFTFIETLKQLFGGRLLCFSYKLEVESKKKVCKFLKFVLLTSWQKKKKNVGISLKAEIGKREENKTNRLQN